MFFKEFLDFSDGSLSFETAVGVLMNIVTMGNQIREKGKNLRKALIFGNGFNHFLSSFCNEPSIVVNCLLINSITS